MVYRTENADKVFNLIKESGTCDSHFISQQTGLKLATVGAILTRLKKQRKLEKMGAGKCTTWRIKRLF